MKQPITIPTNWRNDTYNRGKNHNDNGYMTIIYDMDCTDIPNAELSKGEKHNV